MWYIEEDGSRTELLYRGYDKSTDSLRYGFKPQKHDKRIFRIKCEEDRRIFTPVARSSHKWRRLYKKRTGVERINGRIDREPLQAIRIKGQPKKETWPSRGWAWYTKEIKCGECQKDCRAAMAGTTRMI